jgi:multiple sugar transport system permease protein
MRNNLRTAAPFLLPHFSLFLVFILTPIAAIFALSLFNWNLLGDHRFAGFSNYQELFADRHFWRALGNTALFGAVVVPATLALGLTSALVLNQKLKGRTFFRTAIYLPTVLSSVASATVALWIFDENYGALNGLLTVLHLPRIPWLSSPHFAMPAVILTTLWVRIGLCMVIYLAALQDVPRDQLEAAELDGANWWNRFRFVVWPVLLPSTLFLLLTNLIYSVHVFDVIYIMTGGGPAFSTTVLVQYLYQAAFDDQRQGYACTIAVVLFAILAGLSSALLFSRRRRLVGTSA